MGRVHMNSCDFCVASYDFAAVDGDYDLEQFDTEVTHDQREMLPLLRAARAAVEGTGEALKVLSLIHISEPTRPY